jgi:chromosome segregation ATPase
MKRLLITALAVTIPLLGHAQEEDEATVKLRESLRATVLQVRDLQGQIATLQAAAIAKDQEVAKLGTDLKKVNADLIAERNTSANAITALNSKIAELEAEVADKNVANENWRVEFTKMTERARKLEAERDQLKAVGLAKDRKIADQKAKNALMYQAGTDIIDRYERHGLGDAILSKEPFVGASRAKFQTLMQEYQDKLLDQRIQP